MPALHFTRSTKRAGLYAAAGLTALSLAALSYSASSPVAHAQSAPNIHQAQFAPGSGSAPASFADVVDRVKGSVVSVHVTAGAPKTADNKPNPRSTPRRGAPGQPFGGIPGLPDDHPLNEFFKNFPRDGQGGPGDSPSPSLAQGSGFVISEDGYVITNNHVIDKATRIQLAFDNATQRVDAELIGTDPRTDIALLKIKNPTRKLNFVKLAAKEPRVGDWVLAVGNPFGFGGTVTAGIVSALARDVGSGPYDFLQIDAAVNRGNSGGPTFNLDGEVVGVNTAIYSPSGGNVGIAFAVPARTVAEVVDQLRTSGSVSRGWLGVKIQSIDDDMAASLGLGDRRGALVNEVTDNGPAAKSGVQSGDAILAVNGDKIVDSRELARKVASLAPKSIADVSVLRGGKEQNLRVTLGDFRDASGTQSTPARTEDAPKPEPKIAELSQLGLKLRTVSGKGKGDGVEIAEVDSGSDAAAKGLRAGDVILDVSGVAVNSVDDVTKSLNDVSKLGRRFVLLRVKTGGQTRYVPVQISKG